MDLKGKIIVISGGSSGIGRAAASILKNEGAEIIITGRKKEKLFRAAFELGVHAKQCDISEENDVEDLVRFITEKFQRIDALINNAAVFSERQDFESIDPAHFSHVLSNNVVGPFRMIKAFIPLFKSQKSGSIINIGSSSAVKGYKKGTVYVASKFALRGINECLRDELRPFNIRVSLINPSEVTTGFGQEEGHERLEIPNKLRSFEVAHTIKSVLTMDDRGFIPELNIWATNPF